MRNHPCRMRRSVRTRLLRDRTCGRRAGTSPPGGIVPVYPAGHIPNVGTATGPTDVPERHLHTAPDGLSELSDWRCSASHLHVVGIAGLRAVVRAEVPQDLSD